MLKPIAAAVFLVVLCIASLMIGVAEISFSDFFNGNQHANSIYVVSRIPRLLAIVLAGAGLECRRFDHAANRTEQVLPRLLRWGTIDLRHVGLHRRYFGAG
eukprot:TRINITY_DN11930_c0_g1_i1.p1 TRINITY_DN11930_c0_g1~~TRINITY_DN11930_c0_g1_i1.p1  ORF type:complete len:101 (-),score=4.30 TRINITY_DN11930_c0_g1_i1:116-418(-)